MAEVFLGASVGAEGFSRRVAIKRVLPGFSDNEAFASMFVAEAQLSSQLVHPNIVSVVDFDRDPEGRLFLVMELVEGKDLDALVQTGILPIPVVIFTISEVLRGLGYAHDLPVGTNVRGLIHRDVSPHNVLLGWEGVVKVSDFGIAKAKAASEATASVFIKGKPAYMSPEQANGQSLDGRSDLFAVGIMLWEMLVGRRLFIGTDTRAILAAVLFGQIPRPRSLRPDIPKDLERVVMKLLERELPARYATAEQAIAELLACADAPRNGRELLTQVLQERFPTEAPVRQSAMRARQSLPPHQPQPPGMQGTPYPAAHDPNAVISTPPDRPTMHGHGGPAHANSVGAMMSAPTGTIQPAPQGLTIAPPRRSPKLALVILIAAIGAIAAIAIVAVVSSGGGAPKPAASDGSGSAIALAPPADAPPPIDAAPVPVDAPADAPAPPPDAQKDAPDPRVVQPDARPKKYGTLKVTAFPGLNVTVGKIKLGFTPTPVTKIPVGTHQMKLTYGNGTLYKTESITIEEGKPVVRHFDPPPPKDP